ncbi:energy transducer TonB family protein [Roseobacter sinensis]|uniref:TonB family protein n=1 Tax=Roseobacter sinensis TaxID=2931391 RepID=A0ABT3BLA5_9RHOB|nr:TonB family protein [Roseobacter sp. WL0113]MCV3274013.1 TonB family protein [Roseobacter sp. WL0113]
MTWRRAAAKLAALASAAALHLAVLQPWQSPQQAMTEAGSGAAVASLGTSFADMAAGTQHPRPPQEELTADHAAQPLDPIVAEEAQTGSARSAVPSATPNVEETPAPPVTREARVSSEALSRSPAASRLTTSLRPQPRPDRRPAPAESAAEPQPSDSRSGRDTQDAVRGVATARTADPSNAQGQSTTTPAALGTAAATNYPGVVMRHIARQRRPALDIRGTVVIDFTIGSDGGLATAQVARSSGSSRLDRAALQILQRAAPFPPPPEGARRRHSVGIEGRG